jgi:hypothetical protein
MKIIDHLFCVGPHALIYDFDTGMVNMASKIVREQQLKECSGEPPLPYHSDPLIIQPCALVAKDDLIVEDASGVPDWILWEGMDNHIYMVQPHFCYDAEHTRTIV